MGFSVVAEEVRSLAQRSAQAAKDTAAKIDHSVSKSKEGVRDCADAYQSFTAIQQHVQDLDARVSEIAGSSAEQSEGIAQINNAVQEMDTVTQSTAANAEETAAAAEELNAQALSLHEAIADLRKLAGIEADANREDQSTTRRNQSGDRASGREQARGLASGRVRIKSVSVPV